MERIAEAMNRRQRRVQAKRLAKIERQPTAFVPEEDLDLFKTAREYAEMDVGDLPDDDEDDDWDELCPHCGKPMSQHTLVEE